MRRITPVILIAIIAIAVLLSACTKAETDGLTDAPAGNPDDPVTTAEFVAMIMKAAPNSTPSANDDADTFIEEALALGLIDQDDADNRSIPIERRYAAKIGMEALRVLWGEEDEPGIQAAERLRDLYSCSECVWNVGQFYVKGIDTGRPDGMFYGEESLTRHEAEAIIMRMADKTARIEIGYIPPETGDDGFITPDEALRLLETYGDAILVDVRTPEEYAAGFIRDSINIPLDQIKQDIEDTPLYGKETAIIIVYCQKGGRSADALNTLKAAGFENVYNLGGIETWPYDIYSY